MGQRRLVWAQLKRGPICSLDQRSGDPAVLEKSQPSWCSELPPVTSGQKPLVHLQLGQEELFSLHSKHTRSRKVPPHPTGSLSRTLILMFIEHVKREGGRKINLITCLHKQCLEAAWRNGFSELLESLFSHYLSLRAQEIPP